MPHLHLQTTPGLVEAAETDAILRRLADRISAFPTINAPIVKAYDTVYDRHVIGDGSESGFVHLEVAILDGRAPSLVADIADALYSELKACYRTTLESGRAKVTLELREMPARTYRK